MHYVHVLHDENHMGTTFEFRMSCPPEEAKRVQRLLGFCHQLVSQLELEISEFLSVSPIHLLNHSSPYQRVNLPASALDLLQRSEKYKALTSGYFDCAIKSLALEKAGQRFNFCPITRTAWRLDHEARIGFGAIGKGYALDCVRSVIERQGFSDFILSAGGSSVILSGFAGPKIPWRWGWSWRKDSMGLSYVHESGDAIALGVSGAHEKGSHILSPTRQPPKYEQLSVLVAHPSATEADAISTAAFIAGWESAVTWMNHSLIPYVMASMGLDGVAQWNGSFKKLWGDSAFAWKQSISPA